MVNKNGAEMGVERGWAWHLMTMVAYVALTISLFTGVYDQLQIKWDSEWMGALVLFGAPLALGASWRSRWALVLPLPAAVFAVALARGHGGIGMLILLIFSVPIGVLMIGTGLVVAYGLRRASWQGAVTAVPIALFAVASLPLAESLRRATWQRVPAAERRLLPREGNVFDLCDKDVGPRKRAVLESRERALVAAVREHPDWVTSISDYDEDSGEYTRWLTLRQFAGEHVREFDSGCATEIQRELRAVA